MYYPLHPVRFLFICLHFIYLADDGSDKNVIKDRRLNKLDKDYEEFWFICKAH